MIELSEVFVVRQAGPTARRHLVSNISALDNLRYHLCVVTSSTS